MSESQGGANRQRDLFARSKRPTIAIDANHRLVQRPMRSTGPRWRCEQKASVASALGKTIEAASAQAGKLRGHGVVAHRKLVHLHETMGKLLPQIRYWIRTGWVASGKIINLHIPELYSIVRGKVGKSVEFGLSWGIARLRGGYLLATLARDRRELQDSKFAVRAVRDHMTLFGKAPRAYAYDRAGHSAANVAQAQGTRCERSRAGWLGERSRGSPAKPR